MNEKHIPYLSAAYWRYTGTLLKHAFTYLIHGDLSGSRLYFSCALYLATGNAELSTIKHEEDNHEQ